ncbi:MAG: 3-hydroxyacyl-ACP dehydratase FabZ [Acidobacteriia bacterium]|nr:3-hydroxyacyl-ACP dehydratase FabZ [Terriglobia bacterium]
MPILDIAGIQDLLPHRYPFLLIDRIEVLEEDSVVALKNVTANEPYFQGHFPGYPVMPGVLIVEAMAQAAGVLVLSKMPDRHSKTVYLATVEGARFRRPVVPGDQLRLEVKMLHGRPTRAKLEGKGYVGETLVAEAIFMCVLQDKAAPQ